LITVSCNVQHPFRTYTHIVPDHCRSTLDLAMNLVVCAVMNVDPNGPHAYRHFRSSGLVLTGEPLPNGLHYKPNIMFGMGEVDHFYKRRLNSDVRAILSRMRAGSKHKRYTIIPSMDLYNEKTWSFDLRQIGFEFPKFATNHNPFDLTKPEQRITHRSTKR
jgi:hypothetical protein